MNGSGGGFRSVSSAGGGVVGRKAGQICNLPSAFQGKTDGRKGAVSANMLVSGLSEEGVRDSEGTYFLNTGMPLLHVQKQCSSIT